MRRKGTTIESAKGKGMYGAKPTKIAVIVFFAHVLVALVSLGGVVADDAISYTTLARNLVNGHGYVFESGRSPTAWRAPGYPFFLSAIWSITGPSETAARLANAALWAFTSLVTYRFAEKTIGSNYAGTAALLVGLYPEFLGLTGLLWSESLFILLFTALTYGVYRLQDNRSYIQLGATGVLLGSALLTRSTTIIMVPVIVALVLWCRSRLVLRQSIVVASIGLAILAAWTARNQLLFGRPILVESNTGYNLYVGNRPDTPIPFAWRKMNTARDDAVFKQLVDGKGEAEADAALKSEAFKEILSNPVRTLTLGVGKFFDFWLPEFFVAMNVRSGNFGNVYKPAWPAVLAMTAVSYLMVIFCVLRESWRRWMNFEVVYIGLIAAFYTMPHMLVYGASRYHLPLMPLFIMIATPALVSLFRRSPKRLGLSLGELEQTEPRPGFR